MILKVLDTQVASQPTNQEHCRSIVAALVFVLNKENFLEVFLLCHVLTIEYIIVEAGKVMERHLGDSRNKKLFK